MMLDNCYTIEASDEFRNFKFVSIGSKGMISKAVSYLYLEENFFNLGFGDFDTETGLINDLAVSDNGDMRKVLVTVAKTLYIFTDHYPEAYVTLSGSTAPRTRLYRMGISNNLSFVLRDFMVWGFVENEWLPFKLGVEYEGFLVKRML